MASLFSIFKRTNGSPAAAAAAAASATGDAVQQARTRARRRLIGAVVLLVIGVIGFPLVFETRPRPIPVDIPIEIPKREGAPALVMPPARSTGPIAVSPQAPTRAPTDETIITESRSDAGREIAPRASSAPQASTPERAVPRPVARPAPAPVAEPSRKAASAPAVVAEAPSRPAPGPAPASAAADAVRARALLEAKPAPAAESGRFVVQVGAFAEVESARETRVKVEKLGLKTYTQVAQTPAGSRIRVRVGPFGTRAEADAALAKARAAGLTAVVLTL